MNSAAAGASHLSLTHLVALCAFLCRTQPMWHRMSARCSPLRKFLAPMTSLSDDTKAFPILANLKTDMVKSSICSYPGVSVSSQLKIGGWLGGSPPPHPPNLNMFLFVLGRGRIAYWFWCDLVKQASTMKPLLRWLSEKQLGIRVITTAHIIITLLTNCASPVHHKWMQCKTHVALTANKNFAIAPMIV